MNIVHYLHLLYSSHIDVAQHPTNTLLHKCEETFDQQNGDKQLEARGDITAAYGNTSLTE